MATAYELDEATRNELHELAVQAEAMLPLVQLFAIRSYRALAAFDAAVWGPEAQGVPALEADHRYEELRASSGAGRLLDALDKLANNVDAGRLERPDSEPEWYAVERFHAAERYPKMAWQHGA